MVGNIIIYIMIVWKGIILITFLLPYVYSENKKPNTQGKIEENNDKIKKNIAKNLP